MTIVAINHLKNAIETGEKVLLRSLATMKLPDHTMVANKANRYPECALMSFMNKASGKDGHYWK